MGNMKRNMSIVLTSAGLLLGAAACNSDAITSAEFASIAAVTPVGGATNINPATTISVRFSDAMQPGTEQYLASTESFWNRFAQLGNPGG